MPKRRLRAKYFVDKDGNITIKANPITFKLRKHIHKRDMGICQACGSPVQFWGRISSPFQDPSGAVDHIFPRSRGGQNDLTNLQLLCICCNSSKGAEVK